MMSRLICIASVLAAAASAEKAILPTENLFFYETFDEADPFSSGKWVKSSHEQYADQPVMVKTLSEPIAGFESDKGIQLTQENKHYAFSSQFPTPLSTKGMDLVVQYELKLEEGLTCGGAYVKLPIASETLDLSSLDSSTRYSVMFGPDKCGSNNKVHFIIQYQNPVSLDWEEKHFNTTIAIKTDKSRFHLYTLHVKSNSDFEIFIDKKSAGRGNLLTHMEPAVNPSKEVDDATDIQPDDWVMEAMMNDPSAAKPEDWDEEAPKMIENMSAVKPSGWGDEAPLEIQDPDSSKPGDWDDEEDGEFEHPTIPNPLCEEVGCGEWIRPSMPNPEYKGRWTAPKVANPQYKGVWAPRRIPNPFFFTDLSPASSLAPMAGIAVEVWTTNAGIFFDNFLVAHSLKDAFAFAAATFSLKDAVENSAEEADRKVRDANNSQREKEARAKRTDIMSRVLTKIEAGTEILKENAFISLGAFFVVLLSIALGVIEAQSVRVRRMKRDTAASAQASADSLAEHTARASAANTNPANGATH